MEKGLLNGGLVMPNLTIYYHKALLVACIEWYKSPDEKIKGSLEQEWCSLLLSDWLINDKPSKGDLTQASTIVNFKVKLWLRYKKKSIGVSFFATSELLGTF